MTLYERIIEDRKDALKQGQADRRNCLGFLMAEAKAIAKKTHPSRDPTDEEVLQAIRGILRKNDEVLVLRDDPATREENRILLGYLPTQMEEPELTETINTIIADSGQPKSPKLLGDVMKKLKEDHAGAYDPAMAAQIAKHLLQG